jgi:hypothetical protein
VRLFSDRESVCPFISVVLVLVSLFDEVSRDLHLHVLAVSAALVYLLHEQHMFSVATRTNHLNGHHVRNLCRCTLSD